MFMRVLASLLISHVITVDYHDYHIDNLQLQELQKEFLRANTSYIVSSLNPDDIVDELISHDLLGESARQQLRLPIKTTMEKNRIIVDEVSSGRPGALESFCSVLKKNRVKRYVGEKLEKGQKFSQSL